MTLRKSILLWIPALCALVFQAGAQSLPGFPYEGALHVYVLNGLSPGTAYSFFMASNDDGSGILDDGSDDTFYFPDERSGIVAPGESTALVPVRWGEGASQHVYYLWVVLTSPQGCSTNRALRITPQINRFDLLSENVPVDNTESCPAVAATDGFNPLAGEYNAGTTLLQFRVRREGGTRGWKFEPALTIDPSWNVHAAVVSVTALHAGTLLADATNSYSVPATDSEVLVTVAVQNYEGTEQVVTLTVRNQEEEQTRLNDSNPANDHVEHRILVMPVIPDLEEL